VPSRADFSIFDKTSKDPSVEGIGEKLRTYCSYFMNSLQTTVSLKGGL
jgi:hypothetical protein